MPRSASLETFLTCLDQALGSAALGPKAVGAIDRITGALRTVGRPGSSAASRRTVCRYLDEALATARVASPALARLVTAFAALEPGLRWVPRAASGPFASDNWPDGHANATIVGPGGLEERSDLVIGVSLLAPHVRYPDHDHRPEEVYLVLSPGRFQHGMSDWFEPGIGGTLYNEPNMRHAMASGDAPLFAFWCLWAGDDDDD